MAERVPRLQVPVSYNIGRVIAVLACVVLVLGLATTAVLAATGVISLNGSATITPASGSTRSFAIYDSAAGGSEITVDNDSFFAVGNVVAGEQVSRNVWLENTGTDPIIVTLSADIFGTTPCSVTFPSGPVFSLSDSVRQEAVIVFAAGQTPGTVDFTVNFTPSW